MKYSSLKIFRIIAFLEGISYIALLFIGVPLKYIGNNEIIVKILGMPHGILFVAYIILCLIVKLLSRPKPHHSPSSWSTLILYGLQVLLISIFKKETIKWNTETTFIIIIASIIPFGTFYIDTKYLK